jgi:hypothetical protein
VKRPLIVSFSGEVRVDGCGLRRNILSIIVGYGVRVFERVVTEVGLYTADVDDINLMLGVFLGKFLKCLCVNILIYLYLMIGLAIIQECICSKYIIKA